MSVYVAERIAALEAELKAANDGLAWFADYLIRERDGTPDPQGWIAKAKKYGSQRAAEINAANERADVALQLAANVATNFGGGKDYWKGGMHIARDILKLQSSDAAKVVENSRRYEWALPILTAQGKEGDRRALALAMQLANGLDGDAAIDAARKP